MSEWSDKWLGERVGQSFTEGRRKYVGLWVSVDFRVFISPLAGSLSIEGMKHFVRLLPSTVDGERADSSWFPFTAVDRTSSRWGDIILLASANPLLSSHAKSARVDCFEVEMSRVRGRRCALR
jgi:hypothetical protein